MSKEKSKIDKKTKEEGKDIGSSLPTKAGKNEPMNKEELKNFLLSMRDKLSDKTSAPIYAVGSMNHVLNMANISDILTDENKELARDIWLRVKQSGLHVNLPPMLFSLEEIAATAT